MDLSLFLVSAMFGRFSASLGWARPVWGVSGWFPFTYGWAVTSALRAAREHTLCGVWLPGVVALVAYAVSGHPVTVLDAGAVAGFPCTLARCCSLGLRVCLSVRACLCAWRVAGGVRVLRALFRVGRFTTCIVVRPLGCLFVGCALPCRVLPVCCGLFCLSAIEVVRDS